jgi:hypothetical protein
MGLLLLAIIGVVTWCVSGCVNSGTPSRRKIRTVQFHRFPVLPRRKRLWAHVVSGNMGWTPTHNDRVCSLHFTPADYAETPLRKRLKQDAVPSLQLQFLNTMCDETSICQNVWIGDDASCRETSAQISVAVGANAPSDHDYCSNRTTSLQANTARITALQRNVHSSKMRTPRALRKYRAAAAEVAKLRQENEQLRKQAASVTKICGALRTSGSQYTESQREFACNLHYHSATAYDAARHVLPPPCPYSTSMDRGDRRATRVYRQRFSVDR